MAFSSGTVKSINEFVDAMTVLALANSWVQLDGAENQSDSGVFPFNSRYMRIEFRSVSTAMKIVELDLRATAGGADIALVAGDIVAYSGQDNITDVYTNVLDNNSGTLWAVSPTLGAGYLEFDFGVATTIRELVVTASGTAGATPTDIRVRRSEDGIYWDTIHTFSPLSWSNNEVKVLTLPVDTTNFQTSTATGGVRRPCKYWLQGPGYDIDRRVYVGFELFQNFDVGSQGFSMQGATGFTAGPFDDQLNAIPYERTPMFVIDNTTESIDYWLYINSSRITAVLRAGAGDYACFYAGFLSAFANPDQHTNPLYIAGTSPQLGGSSSSKSFYPWNEANTSNTCAWDPGQLTAYALDYKGDWIRVINNDADPSSGRRPISAAGFTNFWVSPYYFGNTNNGSSVNSSYSMAGGSSETNGDHILKNLVLTLQDELPLFDCIVQGYTYGHVGKLQGLVAIPGAGGLVPEQVITLGLQNYRVFPKRTTRDDAQWVAIEEL